MAGNLWKPYSDSDGNLVILFENDPGGPVRIRDAETRRVIDTGRSTGPSNDRADTQRFSRPGNAYRRVIVELPDGRSFFIENGGARVEDFSLSPPDVVPTTQTGNVMPPRGGPGGEAGGPLREEVGPGGFPSPYPGVPGVAFPGLIDPNLIETFPIEATPIEFGTIERAPYEFTDPLESARETAEFNIEQQARAFDIGVDQARVLQEADLQAIENFARKMSGVQQDIVGQENTFNQLQRLQAAETAIPGIQGIFERQRGRAETLAEGQLLTTAEDRAYELAARSASAEGSYVRGFGADSVVGQRQSEMLSAQQRLGLTQLGEGLLTRSLQQAAGILMDQPLKANISQRLPAQPPINVSQLAGQQVGQITDLTTLAPATALQADIQQQQFVTGLEQSTRQFNAEGVFRADQFNSTQSFQAAQFNSSQDYQAMLARLGIIVSNTQAITGFNQSVLNSIAAAQQVQQQEDFNAQLESDLDRLIDEYSRNRDRRQLQQGIASLLGLALFSPQVQDIVSDIIGGVISSGGDILGSLFGGGDDGGGFEGSGPSEEDFEPDTSDQEPQFPDDDEGVVRTLFDNDDAPVFSDNEIAKTTPANVPSGNVVLSRNRDGTVNSVPRSKFYNMAKRINRPYSFGSLQFSSGADLTLNRAVILEFGPMI